MAAERSHQYKLRGVRIGGLSFGAVVLVVLVSGVAAVGWYNSLAEGPAVQRHLTMIEGRMEAPDQYRMLTPLLAEGVYRVLGLSPIDAASDRLRFAYIIVHTLAFAAAGFFFIAFARRWLSSTSALLGFAILIAICMVANRPGQIQVSDPVNLTFVSMGLLAIQRQKIWLLFLAVIAGAINRESILVLTGYYVLMEWPQPKQSLLAVTVLLAAAWGVAYGALRFGYGMRPYYCDVVMLEFNLESPHRWMPPLLLMAPLVLAALQRPISNWPGPLRRSLLIIPPYILLHLVIARVNELRLFLPLMPVLIALAVFGVVGADRQDHDTSNGD